MDNAVKATLYQVVSNLRTLRQAEHVMAAITKSALHGDTFLISRLVSFASLSGSGSLTHAQLLFEETAMDDTFCCNTMIRAYSRSAFPLRAVLMYNRMLRTEVECNRFTHNFVLKALARILWCEEKDCCGVGEGCGGDASKRVGCKGAEVHCRVVKVGMDGDSHVRNSLVSLYALCGRMDHARMLFDEMPERNVASWNIMIAAHERSGDFTSADWLFGLMPEKNVVSWNMRIARYGRMGDIARAREVFDGMVERDEVTWNSMIAAYVQVKYYDEALTLFHEMLNSEFEATEVTIVSVLGACAEMGALEVGRKIHDLLKQRRLSVDGYLGIALVDMYAKCGNLSLAWEVFNEVKMKPISCWNAMIMGLAVHGFSSEALDLFVKLEGSASEVRPNRITFIGVLMACSHRGLVDEGRALFEAMTTEYGIERDMKHYGCMIDLLSRWGCLDEAFQMIQSMPFKPNSILWRTLLGACRVHKQAELAMRCFQELTCLGLVTDGDYILLSNSFAEAGRWDCVERLRYDMNIKRVLKRPGSSNFGT
ncbi:hypothetical protein MLD38_031557 [Melastoma candidum]|uniref:Uncharacterized protein n=1 Tax=Melastoma candidum TaxID=119954 RepID=A0ACB9MRK6_9MYRT|nr:hypothetical protein MLD38_031557 [Melastoma candidum]